MKYCPVCNNPAGHGTFKCVGGCPEETWVHPKNVVTHNFENRCEKMKSFFDASRTKFRGLKCGSLCTSKLCEKMWLYCNVVTHFHEWQNDNRVPIFGDKCWSIYHLQSCVIKLWLHPQFVKILWFT